MKFSRFIIIICFLFAIGANAQVGYQFSVLDTSTGEPRVNEKISVSVEITDSKGKTVLSSTQSATTDQFGVVSLSVGNVATFADVDWSNLPFYISATVDGVLLSKSQIMSVPVAEHAMHTGVLTNAKVGGRTITLFETDYITFNADGSADFTSTDYDYNGKPVTKTEHLTYDIEGNEVFVYRSSSSCWHFHYRQSSDRLYMVDD